MTTPSKFSSVSNYSVHIKKQVEHLLSNPVFYTHNAPQVSKLTLNIQQSKGSSNVACTNCINKDLQDKKVQKSKVIKKQDEALLTFNKARLQQKQQKDKVKKRQKIQWFRNSLDQHTKLHNAQKIKQKQRQEQQDLNMLKIMRTQVLLGQQKQKMQKRQRSISQLQLKQGLSHQLKQKLISKQKELESNLQYKQNPTCIPLVSCHNKSRNSRVNYKIDLDQMIKQKQNVKRNKSTELIENQRNRLLKVIEREQIEQSKIKVKKQKAKKQEMLVMKQNVLQIENKKNLIKAQKQNREQPIKAFFDEDKRRQKEDQKRNMWKSELREAMIQNNNRTAHVSRDQKRNNRDFSSYRSRENSLSHKKQTDGGIKIFINDDKVCCTKCHQIKPSYAVGNYIFDK